MIGCNKTAEDEVVYLKNEHIKIGILPNVGGRMVYLNYLEDENLLKADKTQWFESDDERIVPSPNSGFKAYNGFITWIGPQSQWWLDQDVNAELRDLKSTWPPDPYLIYGHFKITKKTNTSITLIGPESPVSGVKLTKQYSLKSNELIIKVTAENIRKKTISFDIWSNARFDGFTDFIVPAFDEDLLKVEPKDPEFPKNTAYKIDDGFFYFDKEFPLKGEDDKVSKAFLHPQKGNIIAVRNNTFLLMDFDFVPKAQIHPNQGFIEVYSLLSDKKEDCLLELEHHSAYKTLKPGESSTLTETWSLFEFNVQKDHRDYYGFYKNIINDINEM